MEELATNDHQISTAANRETRAVGRSLVDDYEQFVHTGPGTLAGRYLRLFWQPIYVSSSLAPGRAVPVKVMSERFTLYRGDSGEIHLVGALCAHRKTQLSTGWVEGDCIRCFYHGWVYDETGRCIEQPPRGRPPGNIRISQYPVVEYLGLVFAFLGDGDPPPLPRFTNFEDIEGLLEWGANRRECNYFQNLENSVDHTHAGFVHRTCPGTFDGVTDTPTVKAQESIWGVTATVDRPSGSRLVSQFGMPNRFHVKGVPNDPEMVDGREFLAWFVPVDDECHIEFAVVAVRLPPDKVERYTKRRDATNEARTLSRMEVAQAILDGKIFLDQVDPSKVDLVYLQDDIAQMGQGKIVDRRGERLTQSDAGVIAIRRLWSRELRTLARGKPLTEWRYDPEVLEVLRNARVP